MCIRDSKTAGTFTTNVVKAAPVKWDKAIVESGIKSQVVIVNSGIANACTGEEGYGYCRETANAAAKALGVKACLLYTSNRKKCAGAAAEAGERGCQAGMRGGRAWKTYDDL